MPACVLRSTFKTSLALFSNRNVYCSCRKGCKDMRLAYPTIVFVYLLTLVINGKFISCLSMGHHDHSMVIPFITRAFSVSFYASFSCIHHLHVPFHCLLGSSAPCLPKWTAVHGRKAQRWCYGRQVSLTFHGHLLYASSMRGACCH